MSDKLTPQQSDFAAYYLDPKSETYSDAKNSALKAGFSFEYAENITGIMPKWLSDLIGKRQRLLRKAEKNLESILDIGVGDKDTIKVVADTSKFIAERVGKNDYSNRTELTGIDGKDLIPRPLLGGQSNGDSNNGDKEVIESQEED